MVVIDSCWNVVFPHLITLLSAKVRFDNMNACTKSLFPVCYSLSSTAGVLGYFQGLKLIKPLPWKRHDIM